MLVGLKNLDRVIPRARTVGPARAVTWPVPPAPKEKKKWRGEKAMAERGEGDKRADGFINDSDGKSNSLEIAFCSYSS